MNVMVRFTSRLIWVVTTTGHSNGLFRLPPHTI